jgi:hypothetical protein
MPRISASEAQLSEIYIDESSQNDHTYLVIGGIIIHKQCLGGFTELIEKARSPELPRGEMKWTKVSQTKLSAYTRALEFWTLHATPQCPESSPFGIDS